MVDIIECNASNVTVHDVATVDCGLSAAEDQREIIPDMSSILNTSQIMDNVQHTCSVYGIGHYHKPLEKDLRNILFRYRALTYLGRSFASSLFLSFSDTYWQIRMTFAQICF
jgi:hypothetical protein